MAFPGSLGITNKIIHVLTGRSFFNSKKGVALTIEPGTVENIQVQTKNGNLIGEIHFQTGGVGNALVWTGNYFWTSGSIPLRKILGPWHAFVTLTTDRP